MEALEKENSNDSTDKVKEKVRVVSLDDSTIIANTMADFGTNSNASVWSLCGLNSDDSHVDLGDISPSISPIFTEQQMADHLTDRLIAEDHMFSGEQASGSRPLPDLQSDLELFDREMKNIESLDNSGSFKSKKDVVIDKSGEQLASKQPAVVRRTLRKRAGMEDVSVDHDGKGIALRTRGKKQRQHNPEEQSDKESNTDVNCKVDIKDDESVGLSDTESKSVKDTNEASEKQSVGQSDVGTIKDDKNVDKDQNIIAENEEGFVSISLPQHEPHHIEQKQVDVEDSPTNMNSPQSQTTTPIHSPDKRVTRSTTGTLKPKQKFDEIQEKEESKRKEEMQKRGRKKTKCGGQSTGAEDSKTELSYADEKTSAKSSKKAQMLSKGTERSVSITDDKDSNDSLSEDDEFDFHADDSDYSPEDDPDRPWCICRKPHGNKFMICCDGCEEWFHGKCVGITMEQGKAMEKQGKEYVCDKCREKKAKERLMAEKAKQLAEAFKAKADSTQEVQQKKPKQKRQITSSNVVAEPDSSQKQSHVSAPTPPEETKKRKVKEPSGFKIPKKVRTTPTPVSHSQVQAAKKCIGQGCPRTSFEGAVYCGRSCIERHVSEAVKMLASKEHGGKLHTSEGNRVSMIEKSSGRLVAGMAAPVVTHLTEWILKNPSFQVLVSGTSPTSHSSASFYNKANADSKQKKESDKKSEEDTVRSNVRRMMKDILVERKRESSEIRISVEGIMKLVRQIEDDMYKAFKDTSHRYKAKYRTLMFNLKDPRNKVLYRRVLTGDIPPEKLIWMTSDELATKELAQWREQETKHMIDMIRKEEENTNKARLIKKTHKGEVAVDGDEDLSTLAEAPATKEVEEKKPKTEEKVEVPMLDTTEEHRAHLFDLNCKICTGKMAPPGEIVAKSPTMSSVTIQAAAESSIPSPPPHQDAYLEPLSPDSRDIPSDTFNAVAADKAKETTVWKGFVMMQNVAKFGTNAYLVSGSGDNLIQILPDTLHVHGRIAHKHVWDYVKQCKTSSSRELCIIRFAAATDEEKISYVSLYSYFHSRKRCGVIGNCYSGVKDMYLVPLASHEPIPSHLLPFTGPGLQEPRPHMLLGLIVKNKGAPAKRARSGSDRASSKSHTVEPPSKRSGIDESGSKETTPTPQVSIKPSDSPVDEIEDIVFHYHNTQGTKPEPAKPAQSSAIPPMISALLKIQEQEKRLRELQMQSELLEKELAPKMANIAAPSGQTSSSGRSNLAAVPQSLKGIASFTATAPHPAAGSSAPLLSVDGPKDPSVLSVGVSSTVLASVGHAAGSSIQQGTTKPENDDNEPYDPETASNEEAPYDPEDLEDINLSLDEVPSPDKTETNSAVVVPQSALSKTVTPSVVGASIAETMEKDKAPSTWSKPELDRLNQHNSLVKPMNNQAVANVLSEISMKAGNMNQRSIPRELEEKVQALLKPGHSMVKQTNGNQQVAKATSDIPPRDQYDEQRLSRGDLERMRMEQGRGDPILPFNHSRDFPERRDFPDRRGYREDPAYNNDGRRGDPKFYSSRYSLNARRGSDERSHDKAYDRQDHYRSRDYRGKDDDRHWDDRGRDEKHKDEHFNRNRDRFSRDRWRR